MTDKPVGVKRTFLTTVTSPDDPGRIDAIPVIAPARKTPCRNRQGALTDAMLSWTCERPGSLRVSPDMLRS